MRMNEIANVYSRKPRKIKNNKCDNVNVENNCLNNNTKKKRVMLVMGLEVEESFSPIDEATAKRVVMPSPCQG